MSQTVRKTKTVKLKWGAPASVKGEVEAKGQLTIRPSTREENAALVSGIAKAIHKKGIQRNAIFSSSSPKRVYAYSILPSDTSKIVRQSADGSRTVGHFRNGRFRAVKTQKTENVATA